MITTIITLIIIVMITTNITIMIVIMVTCSWPLEMSRYRGDSGQMGRRIIWRMLGKTTMSMMTMMMMMIMMTMLVIPG